MNQKYSDPRKQKRSEAAAKAWATRKRNKELGIKKRAKPPSRAEQWNNAVNAAQNTIERIRGFLEEEPPNLQAAVDSIGDIEPQMDDIQALIDDYENWKDNIPENLQGGETYSKLDEITSLSPDSVTDYVRSFESESEDIPKEESFDSPDEYQQAVNEKAEALSDCLNDLESALSDLESPDFPRGFGRD